MKGLLGAITSAILTAALLVASAGAQSSPTSSAAPGRTPVRLGVAGGGTPGPITGPAARAMRYGPLPADAAALARAKSRAAANANPAPSRAAVRTPKPILVRGKRGVNDVNRTPSDSTGAIGTRRYIETVNSQVGIYDRGLNLIAQDTLENWWAEPGANVFDPQVIWDPTTNRFYYAGDAVFRSSDNRVAFGFSKTAAPSNATTDWCHYDVEYGNEFPDYPKLGDSKHFAIIGVNVFNQADAFLGSDIFAISKPPAGSTCPPIEEFDLGVKQSLTVGRTVQFTPVPANEIDTNGNGWVLTRPDRQTASRLGIFKVTRNSATGAPIFSAGNSIPVPTHTVPPSAPQRDGIFELDTLDARLTQGVAAVDPSKGGKLHFWTQHAVAGGAGSMERWYEINPRSRTIARTGTVKHSSLYVFNGAISPDRKVNGSTEAFGKNMILGFTTSSETTYPAIRMVGKRGSNGTSSFQLVKRSPGHDEDFGCDPISGVCRWGDYSAATPDPRARTSRATGAVYLSNMWTADADLTGGPTGTSWRTWNWTARP